MPVGAALSPSSAPSAGPEDRAAGTKSKAPPHRGGHQPGPSYLQPARPVLTSVTAWGHGLPLEEARDFLPLLLSTPAGRGAQVLPGGKRIARRFSVWSTDNWSDPGTVPF